MMSPFIRNLLIDLYFLWKDFRVDRRHWLISVVYLVNFFDVNVYVNVGLLMCAVVHKLFADTYITDRFISLTILFSTIVMRLLDIYSILFVLLMVIIHDTFLYSERERRRKLREKQQALLHYWEDVDTVDINAGDDE